MRRYTYSYIYMYLFFVDYGMWHYGQALVLYIRVAKNIWWFIVQFFSLSALLSSFFEPYKRITDTSPRGWSLEAWAGAILINILSRLIGMCVRLVLITAGVATLTLFTMVSLFGYILWLGMPVVIISSIGYGLFLLTPL